MSNHSPYKSISFMPYFKKSIEFLDFLKEVIVEMDKWTTDVRKRYWKGIIVQCHARPQGQTTRAWLKENQICEATYYLWQRRIRQETFDAMEYLS